MTSIKANCLPLQPNMKILLVTKKFPYPLKEGEPIAINYLAKSLVALGCELDLLVLNTSKHYFNPSDLPASDNFFNEIHSVQVQNHITFSGAFRSLLSGQSYILDRFKSKAFTDKLAELLRNNKYDVVQMETIYLAHYNEVVRKESNALLSLRAHNVEHEIWERVAATTPNFLKKWYLKNQNKQLQKFEVGHLNEFDVLLAITGRDMEAFRQLGFRNTGVVAPVGLDLTEYPFDNQQIAPANTVGFIGALDWMPNQHGLVWFLENVWPKVAKCFPNAQFHIAGKNTPNWLRTKTNGQATVHGEVQDAKAFIRAHGVLVAPLFSGSGIKIKVLEGMALGRVVVTTSIGAEGIPALHGQHLLIANSVSDFEKQLAWCFEHPDQSAEIGHAGRELIRQQFDLLEIGKKVFRAYQQLAKH
jgi:polysaccharide biosynthesis protein PslH